MIMSPSFCRWVFVVGSLALSQTARGAVFEVPLTVEESAGVGRHSEPISGGVPLPQGTFPRDQAFALFAANGQEIPCQVSPLVVETDGTLRWILVDFQDEVAAGEIKTYVLRATDPTVTGGESLKVTESAEAVAVDTVALQFAISKGKPFALFDVVRIGSESVLNGVCVSYDQLRGRDAWNDEAKWKPRRLTAGPPESVKVCYAGALRTTIEVAGKFTDDALGVGYKAWITAWRGKSRVWVKFKLCNSNPDQYTAILVGRSTIELKLFARAEKVLLGPSSRFRRKVRAGSTKVFIFIIRIRTSPHLPKPALVTKSSGSATVRRIGPPDGLRRRVTVGSSFATRFFPQIPRGCWPSQMAILSSRASPNDSKDRGTSNSSAIAGSASRGNRRVSGFTIARIIRLNTCSTSMPRQNRVRSIDLRALPAIGYGSSPQASTTAGAKC
jgi:hypothetical protein